MTAMIFSTATSTGPPPSCMCSGPGPKPDAERIDDGDDLLDRDLHRPAELLHELRPGPEVRAVPGAMATTLTSSASVRDIAKP